VPMPLRLIEKVSGGLEDKKKATCRG